MATLVLTCLQRRIFNAVPLVRFPYNLHHGKTTKHSHCFTVLGIETSCDDTGAAIVNSRKEILGESLNNQGKLHREFGGIIPVFARDMHAESIGRVVTDTVMASKLSYNEIDAVAVTVRPGLPLSLLVGLQHAQSVAKLYSKPIIPIHHMEAHALTARLTNQIDFPYMVLLMSGGHCLLAVVQSVTQFKLLGTCIDSSPGDMLDKTARRMRLKTIPEVADLCGGAAIETLALQGDRTRFDFPLVMKHTRDCNFSFAGLQAMAKKYIEVEEERCNVGASSTIPTLNDLCAALQHATLVHMAKRLYRAFLFCEMKNLLPDGKKTLVLSGGVASNQYFRTGLASVAELFNGQVVCPPPRLCTDNGVMIAWNGVEKIRENIDVLPSHADLRVDHKAPLGQSMIEELSSLGLKVPALTKLIE